MKLPISDIDFKDKNKAKIIIGPAGTCKSTMSVSTARQLGLRFKMCTFSNALKFAAYDKFGCEVDTICGAAFVNSPAPRTAFKEITGYDTVILDEILLDGVDCIKWIKANIGKVNIIALTDTKQMLTAEGGAAALKEFKTLCDRKDVMLIELTDSLRPVNEKTKKLYEELYKADSNQIYTVQGMKDLLKCDTAEMFDVKFDDNDTYICHSNKIEHELYKRYGISDRRDITLIPKNHISRQRVVDVNKYPICDQITATDKRISAYLQSAAIATPTRYQGREVLPQNNCYYFVKEDDVITGREIYTVATRCKDIASLKIVVINVEEVKDPVSIHGIKVRDVKHLRIATSDMQCRSLTPSHMLDVIKKYGDEDQAYYTDYVVCKDHIVYTTMPLSTMKKFTKIEGNEVTIVTNKTSGARVSIQSIVKKDTTMHFDFMEKVYNILGTSIKSPRIVNKGRKEGYKKLCDIYSAFPTILKYTELPKAGELYTFRDDNLLNFYVYKGDVLSKGSLITEELAKKVGDSEYVFSTAKQDGCMLGTYTYEQSRASKEKKANVNKNFLWGILEKGYYTREMAAVNGSAVPVYRKDPKNNLELLACALWSNLCLIMLNAVESLGVNDYYVMTDGLYYNSDKDPVLPSWCDYRICEMNWNHEKKEKYENIIYKSYQDPPTEKQLKAAKEKKRRSKK